METKTQFVEESWMLLKTNLSAYSALSVQAFFAKYGITMLEHPPSSPNLSLCGFYLLLSNVKVMHCLKRDQYQRQYLKDTHSILFVEQYLSSSICIALHGCNYIALFS